jgi:hypothetical protein
MKSQTETKSQPDTNANPADATGRDVATTWIALVALVVIAVVSGLLFT